jgi:hypothetical protein
MNDLSVLIVAMFVLISLHLKTKVKEKEVESSKLEARSSKQNERVISLLARINTRNLEGIEKLNSAIEYVYIKKLCRW